MAKQKAFAWVVSLGLVVPALVPAIRATHLSRPIVGPEYGYFCGHCERVFSCYEISFTVCTLGHASETLWIIDEAVCISYSLT
jgi:hypothetical protein